MKELNRKVFKTIFIILSSFMILGFIFYNASLYVNEYEDVQRNLMMINDRNNQSNMNFPNPFDRGIENMMIMDYEVYTVILDNHEIEQIIYHSNTDSQWDVEKVAKSILKKDKGIHISYLYFSQYSYHYTENSITIIHTETVRQQLLLILLKSFVLWVIVEAIVFMVSQKLTQHITKPAQESFEKQKDFITDASHELKTPLAVIMASSDELKSDKKNVKYVENIKSEAERMNNLIKGLLDLSKLEKGISIQNYQEENLSKIIERMALTFEGVAFEKNVLIETDVPSSMNFYCSKEEMEKLFSIILDNAVKHSDSDSTIKVRAKEEKNHIAIEVINQGEPIAPGDEEKIFERFYRSDKSRNRDANRYGLGLAIAKNIVMNHNGSIKAFSKDQLTTFKIIFKK